MASDDTDDLASRAAAIRAEATELLVAAGVRRRGKRFRPRHWWAAVEAVECFRVYRAVIEVGGALPPPGLTLPEAAVYLAVPLSSLRSAVEAGRLVLDGAGRLPLAEVERLAEILAAGDFCGPILPDTST